MDNVRPRCINYGCNNLCHWSGKRYRPVCGRCHLAGFGAKTYKEGVVPFRTGICCNQDGHLGFPCATDYEKAPHAKGITQIDHKNGNLFDNTPENAQELCPICHTEKGKREGDFKKQNKYANNLVISI